MYAWCCWCSCQPPLLLNLSARVSCPCICNIAQVHAPPLPLFCLLCTHLHPSMLAQQPSKLPDFKRHACVCALPVYSTSRVYASPTPISTCLLCLGPGAPSTLAQQPSKLPDFIRFRLEVRALRQQQEDLLVALPAQVADLYASVKAWGFRLPHNDQVGLV